VVFPVRLNAHRVAERLEHPLQRQFEVMAVAENNRINDKVAVGSMVNAMLHQEIPGNPITLCHVDQAGRKVWVDQRAR
jgi:hypothetical protein